MRFHVLAFASAVSVAMAQEVNLVSASAAASYIASLAQGTQFQSAVSVILESGGTDALSSFEAAATAGNVDTASLLSALPTQVTPFFSSVFSVAESLGGSATSGVTSSGESSSSPTSSSGSSSHSSSHSSTTSGSQATQTSDSGNGASGLQLAGLSAAAAAAALGAVLAL